MGTATSTPVTVGIFGGSGYSGRELLVWLRRHAHATVVFTTGSSKPHIPHDDGLARDADAYFLCVPHGTAAQYAVKLRELHPSSLVIDLSGDLRLRTAASYKQWYGHDHPAPALLEQAVFGLTEVFRDRIVGAQLISNPGCYATSVMLPLLPLIKDGLVEATDIIVDSKSGASGAGRSLREDLLFCEVEGSLSIYSQGRAHRHVGEIEETIAAVTGVHPSLTFSPHLLPVERGILSAIYVRTLKSVAELRASLSAYYEGAPFVRVVDAAPKLKDVNHTNLCLMSVHEGAPGRAIVVSALDNLVKGASGQAIQNMNVALGFEETEGLF
ncbi:MAG: N-acetyl-gamma-glutamyl-phosphate reductase [Vicinamibacteria bacterium]